MPYISNRYKRYLNTTVEWQARTGYDEYSKPSYSASTSIPARFVQKRKLVKDGEGTERVSNTVVMVAADVNEQDKINGELVLSIESATELGNEVAGKLVYL